jgi:exonuclease III
VKIATWNVNGIRARQDGRLVRDAREARRVVPAGGSRQRATTSKTVGDIPGYWCYWHGTKGYSGVALFVRKEIEADRPMYIHPTSTSKRASRRCAWRARW